MGGGNGNFNLRVQGRATTAVEREPDGQLVVKLALETDGEGARAYRFDAKTWRALAEASLKQLDELEREP